MLAFASLVVCTVVLAGCGGDSDSSSEDLPVAEIDARWATDEAESLASLTETRGWVFLGEVTGLQETLAVDLVPGDDGPQATVPGKPVGNRTAPPTMPVSLFDVRVDEVIAGDLAPGQNVTVRQMGGTHEQSTGELIQVVLDGDAPLQAGNSYLFFVAPGADGVFQTVPYARMQVAADGSLFASRDWAGMGAMQELAGQSPAAVAALIEDVSAQ